MTAETTPATPPEARRKRPLWEVGRFVEDQIRQLQNDFLSNQPSRRAGAVADLARLRRGVGKPVGALPELWRLTLDGVPAGHYSETAAYAAITLYAVHQQSRSDRMHRPGDGFGRAVRLLQESRPQREGQRIAPPPRFQALATANSFAEVEHHARALITQLREEGIALDYGEFADQLVDLQKPGRADRVRLAWGRDFYRIATRPKTTDASDVQSASTEGAA
jgi:CRISPR system Cascade subunit CasB